jgi:hypothetical protein
VSFIFGVFFFVVGYESLLLLVFCFELGGCLVVRMDGWIMFSWVSIVGCVLGGGLECVGWVGYVT